MTGLRIPAEERTLGAAFSGLEKVCASRAQNPNSRVMRRTMPLVTKPNRSALFVMLAQGNHMDGALLERAAHWIQYSKAKIPGTEGKWVANKREWWMQEAQLSADQYDRASRRLRKLGLIEKGQYWFSGRCILYLRPTQTTLDFIQSAKTWQAAREFLEYSVEEDGEVADPGESNIADVSTATPMKSNGYSKIAMPGSTELLNPNNMEVEHGGLNLKEKLTGAHQASPVHAPTTAKAPAKTDSGKEKKEKGAAVEPQPLQSVIKAWRAVVLERFGKPAALSAITGPSAKEKAYLALGFESLSAVWGKEDKSENLQPHAADIVVHTVRHWDNFLSKKASLPKYPTLTAIFTRLDGEQISYWHSAGRPAHGLDDI
jgi:hypothetical protein